MKQPLYLTPRALLIQYLDDNSHPDIASWIVEGSTFKFTSWNKLREKWVELARLNKMDQQEYYFQRECDFLSSLMSGILLVDDESKKCQITTKSIQKRKIVSDLKPGNLHEFIIGLLLERTRIDWLDWSNKDQLEFRINTKVGLKKMGDEYVKVNNIKTNNSVYYMKLMLASLCTTGILIKSQKSKYGYKFNKEWYEKEIKREVDGEDDPNEYTRMSEQVVLSHIHYPRQTRHDILPCCGADHSNDEPYY